MAGSVVVTGLFTTAWLMAAMGLVAGVLSATAMSWHGILQSETARLAPADSLAVSVSPRSTLERGRNRLMPTHTVGMAHTAQPAP
jgi:hypothetical protein